MGPLFHINQTRKNTDKVRPAAPKPRPSILELARVSTPEGPRTSLKISLSFMNMTTAAIADARRKRNARPEANTLPTIALGKHSDRTMKRHENTVNIAAMTYPTPRNVDTLL